MLEVNSARSHRRIDENSYRDLEFWRNIILKKLSDEKNVKVNQNRERQKGKEKKTRYRLECYGGWNFKPGLHTKI
jgi:hypothetical protein